jgi:hypothetical protein
VTCCRPVIVVSRGRRPAVSSRRGEPERGHCERSGDPPAGGRGHGPHLARARRRPAGGGTRSR